MNKFFVLALSVLCALQILQPSSAFANDTGGVAGGGGNSVKTPKGDQLFDDYVNEGTLVIPADDIAKLAEPYLNDLSHKVPALAEKLRAGIKGVIWYREPKLLNQTGICLNGSDTGLTPPIGQTVRACQNKLEIRIEKDWYDNTSTSNSTLVAGLIVHELLVYQRIRSPKIIEAGVMRMSRNIRSLTMSAEDLQTEAKITDFGDFETVPQALKSTYKAIDDQVGDVCIAEVHSPNYKPSQVIPGLEASAKKYSQLMTFADAKTLPAAQKQLAVIDKIIKGIKGKNSYDYCGNKCRSATGVGCAGDNERW